MPADMMSQEVGSRSLSEKLDQHLKKDRSAKPVGALGRRAWRSRRKNKMTEWVAEERRGHGFIRTERDEEELIINQRKKRRSWALAEADGTKKRRGLERNNQRDVILCKMELHD